MEKREYKPSPQQAAFHDWIEHGTGSTLLTAVAGSGKSTTIVRSLERIPESKNVLILAFNHDVAAEMREKIAELSKETGRPFQRVSAKTFHSLGMGAVRKRLGGDPKVDGAKCRKIYEARVTKEVYDLYGAFVPRLVSLGKGYGIGCLVNDTPEAWQEIVDTHDLSLDSEDADMGKAIDHASKLLRASTIAAQKGSLDFDDQLYLPVLWGLKLWKHDFVVIDEAQDTNPIRRALAKMALLPGGRLGAVGDRNQAIYMFTGASSDAMDIIAREFRATEMPLTVSYRCPKAAEELVRDIVPHFTAYPNAPLGSVLHMGPMDGVKRLSDSDVVLCRNTAPLVDLAFQLIAQGRGCAVLGKDIAAGLVNLIKQQRAQGIDALIEYLEVYRDAQVTKLMAKGEEQKADAITDRTACVLTVISNLARPERTIPRLIAKIEGMFSDSGKGVLTLCTAHKSKGREWDRVALLEPELMPSKWARSDEAYQQELNLIYVARTRFKEEFIFLDGVDEAAKESAQVRSLSRNET